MNVIINLLERLRCCPNCSTSLGRTEWLCDSCLNHFLFQVESSEKRNLIRAEIPHFYLADWKPEDRFMHSVVHSLKGGKLSSTYQMLAKMFLLKQGIPISRGTIVYPSKGEKDHAFEWSLALANLLNLNFLPLELVSEKKQALLSRGERQRVLFKPLKVPKNSPLILADDIVTTGATAKAAWQALGQPKSFAVWSIFYRRSL